MRQEASPTAIGSTGQDPPLWTRSFVFLCLSAFLFFLSFNSIIAELPTWLEHLGNKDYLPFIVPIFTLAALISRPFSGHLADTVGRKPIIYVGLVVSTVCGLIYPVVLTAQGFLLLRFLHGFSTGFTPTGNTALLTDIMAPSRRGESMGILGISASMGMAMGPPTGSWIAMNFDHEWMFRAAAACGILSMLMVINIKESLPSARKFKFSDLAIPSTAMYEPRAFMPALMALLTLLPFGVMITIIPDKSDLLGIENRGLFFLVYVVFSMLVRLPAGKISDRVGRSPVTMISALLIGFAMILVALSDTKQFLLISAAVGGTGAGLGSPILFAWTADLALEAHRARAFSTTFMALEIGIGGGGLIGGLLYDNDPSRIHLAFYFAAAVCLSAVVILLWRRKRLGTWD